MDERGSILELEPQWSVLACPHCFAGVEEAVVGLFWESSEKAWRCLYCGHRSFERPRRTVAQLLDDALWDELLIVDECAERCDETGEQPAE
jgi:DNA-directed RNA polymerase subunit RPC12/RpoP